MSDYRVNLDIFAGPMDLLLYLVRKEEVDIYDIPLTKITDQYLHYIELLKEFDIDIAGDFLVMAATLMQIKSSMLLPKADPEQVDEDDLSDPRTELIRQLLEYKKYKDAANLLEDSAQQQSMRFQRPDTILNKLKPTAEPEIDLEQVSIWDLLEAFGTIMAATGSYADMSNITDDTPIDLYQIELLHRLQAEGPVVFERIFESKNTKVEMIGLFLALLELIRSKLVWVEQPEKIEAIYVKPLTDEPAEQAVQKAMLATEAEIQENQIKQAAAEQPRIPIHEISSQNTAPTIVESASNAQAIPIQQLPPEKEPEYETESNEQKLEQVDNIQQ